MYYKIISERQKFPMLCTMLDRINFCQAIIFANRIDKVKNLEELLTERLFNPISIHSSLPQQERLKRFDEYRQRVSQILVATDLFGRGVDLTNVNLVINYDFPTETDTYMHRVGRAGRFGGKGLVINFVRPD